METVDSIVIIGMLNLKAFFVNYIPLVSRIDDLGWSRAVAVNNKAILIAEIDYNSPSENSIREYDLQDPYELTQTKFYFLSSNNFVFPIISYFSDLSDLFYIYVYSGDKFSIFTYRVGESSSLNSLYYNYTLGVDEDTVYDNLFLAVGGLISDYLIMANQKTNAYTFLHVPHRPTLFVKPKVESPF